MADHTTADLRNFAIAGHGSSGKTTLAEAILFKAGATSRFGKPEDGTSIADADVDEKERQFTIYSSLLHAKHEGKLLQIIDTPGYDDFFGEVAGDRTVGSLRSDFAAPDAEPHVALQFESQGSTWLVERQFAGGHNHGDRGAGGRVI